MEQQLMTTRELAAKLGVTPNTLAIWRFRGMGPKWVRLGTRIVRYRPSDVDEFLRDGTATGPSQ